MFLKFPRILFPYQRMFHENVSIKQAEVFNAKVNFSFCFLFSTSLIVYSKYMYVVTNGNNVKINEMCN